MNSAACYRVGDLTLDSGRGRVMRGEQEINLPKLSYQLFLTLVRAAPNLMSLDALMETVWHGVVVSPETVCQRVKLLRHSLGDNSKAPRYIAGVRGRGYHIIADVSLVQPAEPPAAAVEPPPQPVAELPRALPLFEPRVHRFRAAWVIALLLSIVPIGGALWWFANRLDPLKPPPQFVTLTAAPARSVAVLPFENLDTSPAGRELALGIAETVLHQLASLDQLIVIARSSSFAIEDRNQDARLTGRALNARYLLGGSVQQDSSRLRVTAQLVDSQNGAQLWSMRFDRAPSDVFAVQDEIAVEVARALELTLDKRAIRRLTGRGTKNVDAHLAYLQGLSMLTSRKIEDLQRAKERFTEAIRLDPSFADPRVSLAEAHVLEAYFPLSEFWFTSKPNLSPAIRSEVDRLLSTALKLDPRNGQAYVVRAWATEGDYLAAEADFRRGLALSPSNAVGMERFARRLFFFPGEGELSADPHKRAEAFALIDQARALDPLAPTPHLTKALMVLYGRSNVTEANSLMLQALENDPNYYPALMRLAELRWCCQGEFAEAIRYGEQALALEPRASWPRHFLVPFYVDIGDINAARNVIDEAPRSSPVSTLQVYIQRRDWKTAADIAYAIDGPISGLDANNLMWAALQQAILTRHTARARKLLEQWTGMTWDAKGEPVIANAGHDYSAPIALAQLMLIDGEQERATKLLRQAIAHIGHEAKDLGRGEMWFGMAHARALALLGENENALRTLQASFDSGFQLHWEQRLADSAFDSVREDPRFQKMVEHQRRHAAEQRTLLQKMRTSGIVPKRANRKLATSRGAMAR